MRTKLAIGVAVVLIVMASVLLIRRSLTSISNETTVIVEPSTLEVRSDAEAAPLSFVVKNQSAAIVEILDVTASCGCTVVKVPRRKLNPQEAITVDVQASPPGVGERTSVITVQTMPRQQRPLSVLVSLKGKAQPKPDVSYCPETISLNGSRFGETVTSNFEVDTLEKPGTSPWLLQEQHSDSKLRIWYDEAPTEKSVDSETVRRIYKMTASAVLPGEGEEGANRVRHVLVAHSKGSRTDKSIAFESRVIPLVKAVPAIINLAMNNGEVEPVERRVAVIDDRENRSGQIVRSRVDCDWLNVETIQNDLREQRSVHSFKVVFDPRKLLATSNDSVIRTTVTFALDDKDSTSVQVPIVVRVE